jgi:outer membrane protein insertion porin family
MKRLLLVLMLASAWGFAQTPAQKKSNPPAPTARWPIESLSVEGTHNFSREQVIAVAGLRIGQIAGRPEFEAARDRLIACGAFDTVSYKFTRAPSGNGYAAILQVAEVEQVYPVHFDNLHVSERDLVASLQAKDPLFAKVKLPATHPIFERYSRWVEEYLAGKGITEKIVGTVMPDRPGEYAIVFQPARALPVVALVSFQGNQVLPQETLKEAVLGSAVGSPYTEDRFREILNSAVRPLYEARGRIRIAFPAIKTEPAKDVQGVNVLVTIDEGESYKLGKVAIDDPTPLKPEELLKAGDFKTGDVANFDRVNEGLEKVRKALRHAGYMQADVTSRRRIDDDRRVVDVTLWINAGPQFSMGKLTIVGLDLSGEAEVNRIWTMKPGKPFNPDYPDLFLQRVRAEGLFDNLGKTKAEYTINEPDHTADVTLTFGATTPGSRGRRGARI